MKSNGTAPAALTLGACAAALAANGFTPISALRPDGQLVDLYGKLVLEPLPDYVISEDAPAIKLGNGLALLVLTLAPVEDADLRQSVLVLLAKLKLLDGPVRVGADDRRAYLLRCPATRARRVLDDSVRIFVSGILPLDGQWPAGSLLDTPLADLPHLDDAEQLFEPQGPLSSLPYILAESRLPPPAPHVRGWLGESA